MGLLTWIIIGLLAGTVVSRLRPTSGPAFAVALTVSVSGAIIGGYICAALNVGSLANVELTALFAALAGSLIFILIFKHYGHLKCHSITPRTR